ncbi:MAG: hypothetical protein JO092_11645 [Candidatus Eremiobacteraeota bacterium]|nr:hypothetical protein [Candidatus Eremiobacteraeota bacterium]
MNGCGVVYKLAPQSGSSSYQETVLFTFHGSDGAAPLGPLLMDAAGNLYGTTYQGGKYGEGTVFELAPSGSSYVETVLHSFGKGDDGAYPHAGLIEAGGILYGTTIAGGRYSNAICKNSGGSPNGTCGTAFAVIAGTGKERVLHSFGSGNDGASPFAGLVQVNGTLYGATDLGGTPTEFHLCGTVFSLSTTGSEHVIHRFTNTPNDGCNPFGRLIAINGTLYGTTCCGGTYFGAHREGSVYSLDIATGVEKVLHNFGNGHDGSEPQAALVELDGRLYGTTNIGGVHCKPLGCGTIFSLLPIGSQYRVEVRFRNGAKGHFPTDALLALDGSLYGTTTSGGLHDLGTAFKLTP